MAIVSGKNNDPGGLSKEELKALESLIGAGSGGSSGGKVYMGSERYTKGGQDKGSGGQLPRGKTMYGNKPIWLSESEATSWYYNQSAKWQSDFIAKAIVAGMLKYGDGPMEGAKKWTQLVKEAAKYGAVGKKVSPFDLMASYVNAAGGAGANAWRQAGVWEINTQTGERRYMGPGKYLGDGKAQQTDTRIDLTDPDTARSIATRLFQDMMGRDPGAGELGAFASALHDAERNSPVVSTTTTEYDMDTGQQLSSSTQQSGGMTAEGRGLIAENQIKKSKEYGAFQAATTYQNVMESLVFGAPE